MSNEQLRHELRSQKMFIDELTKKYVEREKEIGDMRMEILEKQKVYREQLEERSKNNVKHLEDYYNKKVMVSVNSNKC